MSKHVKIVITTRNIATNQDSDAKNKVNRFSIDYPSLCVKQLSESSMEKIKPVVT